MGGEHCNNVNYSNNGIMLIIIIVMTIIIIMTITIIITIIKMITITIIIVIIINKKTIKKHKK